MGLIKRIHRYGKTKFKYQWRNYLGLELTENIHLHYRNIRLEFTPEEFLFIREVFCSLTPEEIERIKTRKYGFDEPVDFLRITDQLPENKWWEDTYSLEEQKNGMFHFHLGNLRLDLHQDDAKKIFDVKEDDDGKTT